MKCIDFIWAQTTFKWKTISKVLQKLVTQKYEVNNLNEDMSRDFDILGKCIF
jgi:hypothetical protein